MKKIVTVLGLAVLLTACGVKKEATESSKNEKEISTTLPVFENAEKNKVVTRVLRFPQSEDGARQTQTVVYKGEQFLSLTVEQILPMGEEMKKAVAEVGVAEAQQLLNKSLEEDENYKQVKDLPGFSATFEIMNEQELKRVNQLDFQVLDVDKAAETTYLKNMRLKELLKRKPAEYVESQLLGGAKEDQ